MVIFPGMKIGSKALNSYTAKIPLIDVEKKAVFKSGKSTLKAVQGGLYFGYLSLINGMISRYKILDPDLFVVGTGNGLRILQDQLDVDVFDYRLSLKGLAYLANSF